MDTDLNQSRDEGEAFALNKWQRCIFSLNSTESKASDKAEALRGILNQLHFASATECIPEDLSARFKTHYTSMYSAIIDCSNPETGLNNFAEGALALSSNHPNESSEWKSSLTLDSIKNMDIVKQLLAESKKCSEKASASLKADAESLLKATRQPPPSNTSNWQHKPQYSSHSSVPTSNVRNVQTPGSASPPPGHIQTSYGVSSNPLKETMAPARNPAPLFATSRDPRPPNQPTPHFPRPTPTVGNRPPSHPSHAPSAPRPHPQRGYTPMGANRAGPSPGSMGYDPASQMVNLGILGMGDNAASGGQPPLKRKFGASESRQGGFNSGYNRGPRPRQPDEEENEGGQFGGGAFKSAKEQLNINNQKKFGNRGNPSSAPSSSGYGTNRKVLGVTRRAPNSKFVPPVLNKEEADNSTGGYKPPSRNGGSGQTGNMSNNNNQEEPADERLKNIEPKMVELVMSEIMDHGPPIHWDDIAGLEFAKKTIKEIVVWPMLRPDIFTGLRGPPKGLLLFGPPGTGKTLIGKCIASQSGATFFSISASSLTSKWVGEGEKMVRALFAVARCHQPAVIFIDEIDSLLSQRSNDEHESSRRIKTEFLVQLDGATTCSDERLLIVGATNRPQEIDEAARRRLVKRLYIPLPDSSARGQIVTSLLTQQSHSLVDQDLESICQKTEGYSGADMATLCREAALGPIRSIQGMDIQHISADQVRPILHGDFEDAIQNVRPSVAQSDLDSYLDWNAKFGCGSAK
ncbi:fidgetin-like protein 1 [Strongylocentrotus purpuratus]|uniref:Fidgetin-like protein 1 n=1 Tax=Strongylocentrotus purpuratus TaxID=7668 RepID=A0A7M7NV34_STRPU|nr:fidgetin-like protein 1 [Strongylocentrotus purpuratus]